MLRKLSSRLVRRFARRGLSQDTINQIRTELYGLPAETKHPHPSCQTNEGKKGLDPETIRGLESLLGLRPEKPIKRDYVCINITCPTYAQVDVSSICRCPLCCAERIALKLSSDVWGDERD